ncbi:MAG: hypothetical protein PHW73_09730 [Atribacterota bacterium]|nr:hypothetical protein [Atribacterota bacterium]
MFFHTHVYYSKRIDKNLDPLRVVGSFLPDLALTGVITWDDLHKKKNILEFFDYVKKNNAEYKSLLKGINYHNTLDYYTHLKYKNKIPGYAYANIPTEMPPLLEKALGITPQRAISSSHNCIEGGVEYHLLHDDPDLRDLVKKSISQIDKENLAKLFADFFKKDQAVMLKAMNKLFSFATDYDFETVGGWLKLWTDMNKFYLNKETNSAMATQAMEMSFKITKDTYREFIEYTINSQDKEIRDSN